MFESPVRCVVVVALLAALAVGVPGCGTLDQTSNRLVTGVSPYKIDVVQGNFVSREQAAALKPGMSRIQVRDILGTPLLASIFHADRWDYVFTFRRQGVAPQARRVTVFFKADVLERIEADALPSEAEFVASLDSGRKSGTVPILEMPEVAGNATVAPVVAKPAAPSAPSVALPASYPPLEGSAK